MIETVLRGRLGNVLFQYAAARSLALRTGTRVTMNLAHAPGRRMLSGSDLRRSLRFFNLAATYTNLDPDLCRMLERVGLRERRAEFVETAWGYDPRFQSLGAATRLVGYFQSPAYWFGCEDTLRRDLSLRSVPDLRRFAPVFDAIGEGASVSVHVRRADYLTTERMLHAVCTIEYYDRAIDHMRERLPGAHFFVFSDDPAWCRAHFTASDMSVVQTAGDAALDLHLMSRCRHHVISNSTYGWWGAWLNDRPDKIVCAPDRWFNDPEMSARAMRFTVPLAWQRISCDGQALPR